jgi:hypothetical protein
MSLLHTLFLNTPFLDEAAVLPGPSKIGNRLIGLIDQAARLLDYNFEKVSPFSQKLSYQSDSPQQTNELQAISLLAVVHYALAEAYSKSPDFYHEIMAYIGAADLDDKTSAFYAEFMDHEFTIYTAFDKINTPFVKKFLQSLLPNKDPQQLTTALTHLKIHASLHSRRDNELISDSFFLQPERLIDQSIQESGMMDAITLDKDKITDQNYCNQQISKVHDALADILESIADMETKLEFFNKLNSCEKTNMTEADVFTFLKNNNLIQSSETSYLCWISPPAERIIAKNNALIENASYWLLIPENRTQIPDNIKKLESVILQLDQTKEMLKDTAASLEKQEDITPRARSSSNLSL